MSDILHREVEVPCPVERAWRYVLDPTWLGDDGEIDARPGGEGWVRSGSDTRFLIVEEIEDEQRLVYRWASYTDEPSRVEIDLVPSDIGTRISIVESPLEARAQASLSLR